MSVLGDACRCVSGRRLVGAAAAIARRLYRSHRFVVLRGGLAGPPADDHADDVVFRLATPLDLDRLDDLDRYGRGARQRTYVTHDNDWLFVACHGDRIVATRRYSRTLPAASRDGHGLMPRVLQLQPGEVWAADAFCVPEYRRRRIGRHLGLFADRFLAALGYTQLCSAVSLSNVASIRLHLQIGRQPLCYVSYVRVFFYERLRISKKLPRRFGVRPSDSTSSADWPLRLIAAARVIRRYVYCSHRFIVMRTVLAGPPVAEDVGDVVFRLATLSDLDRLEELERYGRASRHRLYIRDDNDWLFVACDGDRIVATRRYSRTLPPATRDGHGLMSRVLQLGPDQVWAADTFCLPEYRNRGIARLLGLYAMRSLASDGYKENFGTIAVGNTPSLRMAHHQGSQPLYYVSYVRVLFYERLRVSKNLPGRVKSVERHAKPTIEGRDDPSR